LLVVEDDPATLATLRAILEAAGYKVRTAANGKAALEVMAEERPSLILSDISMPVMDGIQLFSAVRKLPGGLGIPFILLTDQGTCQDIFAGKSMGGVDTIPKPISGNDLIAAVQSRLQRTDAMMMRQLIATNKASLRALENAIEARDPSTRDSVDSVNAYAQTIARELEWEAAKCEILEFAALLHDFGKIQIPSSILTKRGPLTEKEWEEMRRHPEYGAHMIRDIPHLAPAVPMILHHHENWDGSGYPDGLRGKEIPEEARLIAVANAFDTMTSDQPYRTALAANDAFNEIVKHSGSQFDPGMVEAFRRCWDRGDIQEILSASQ